MKTLAKYRVSNQCVIGEKNDLKRFLLDFEYNVLVSEYLFCVSKYGSKQT